MLPFPVLAVLQQVCGSEAANTLQKVFFFLYFSRFTMLNCGLPSSEVI